VLTLGNDYRCLLPNDLTIGLLQQVRIVKLMYVLCGVLPRLHLSKKEGEKRGRRIEGRELAASGRLDRHNLYGVVGAFP